MRRRLLVLGLITLPLALAPARAAARMIPDQAWQVAAADDWQTLNEEERRLLGPHRGRWRGYTPEQRERLRQGVQRYRELSPQERERVRRQRERFESLSPEERRELRERYRRERGP